MNVIDALICAANFFAGAAVGYKSGIASGFKKGAQEMFANVGNVEERVVGEYEDWRQDMRDWRRSRREER